MKKALVFVLAVVMVMAMAVPASAVASPTAPTTSETTTAPVPVVVETEGASSTVVFVPVEDVKTLPAEAQETVAAAQEALAEAAPAGMKVQYFCYVTVEKSDETKADEPATITLKIDNAETVVVKQFIDGEWVELEAVVNADGTITVKGVVDGPIAIFTK